MGSVVSLQVVRFAAVGTLTAFLYFTGYNLLRVHFGTLPALASAIAYAAAIIFQYIGHAFFTFRRKILAPSQIARFVVTNGMGLAFSMIGAFLMVSVLMMSDWISSIIIVLALPVINWVVMRRWVFN